MQKIMGIKMIRRSSSIELEKDTNALIEHLNKEWYVFDVQFFIDERNYYTAMIKYGSIIRTSQK